MDGIQKARTHGLIVRILMALATAWASCTLVAGERGIAGPVLSGIELSSLVAPFDYREGYGATVLLRADRVYRDYAQKGFFKIGVLPVAVVEGLTVEVRQPRFAAELLSASRTVRGLKDQASVEIRGFQLVIAGCNNPILKADQAEVLRDGNIELRGGVQWLHETNQIRAPSGRLILSGPEAGNLILNTASTITNNLLTVCAVAADPHHPHETEQTPPAVDRGNL